jgi:hypothetical protein
VTQAGRWVHSPISGPAHVLVQARPTSDERRASALARATPPLLEPPRGTAAPEHPDETHMEVHGVPMAIVFEVVEAAGGEVLDVGENRWAGPQWLRAHYTVRRR